MTEGKPNRPVRDHFITIDGSAGEGGGQILRTAAGLSAFSGRPVRIHRIRVGRPKPGLMRQHLTAMNAAAEICSARMSGAAPGSTELTFEPQEIRPGNHHFSVGTAGSATLVLQTILPALLTASGPSQLIIEGGTHNQWAPTFDFLQRCYLPLINRMGPVVRASLERCGFYPAGGGRLVVTVEPSVSLCGFDLCERGQQVSKEAGILISNLPHSIARREAERLSSRLSFSKEEIRIRPVDAEGPGNVVFAELCFEHVTEIFTGFGRAGASAENVAEEVVQQVRRYLKSSVPVGECLADQLLLPLGISAAQAPDCGVPRGGTFRTLPLSRHATTHIQILEAMLAVRIVVTEEQDGCRVFVGPAVRAGNGKE